MKTDSPLVLGIETSCDETGVGIVRGHELLADAVASSVAEHARFGGVVPEVASRAHLEAMIPTFDRALATAGVGPPTSTRWPSPPGPAWPEPCWWAWPRPRRTPTRWASRCTASTTWPPTSPSTSWSTAPLPAPAVALLVSGGHSSLLLVPDVAREVHPARRDDRRRGRRGLRQGGPGARHAVPRRPADRQGGPGRRPRRDQLPARQAPRRHARLLLRGPEDRGGPLGGGPAGGRGAGARRRRGRLLPGGGGRRADPQGRPGLPASTTSPT